MNVNVTMVDANIFVKILVKVTTVNAVMDLNQSDNIIAKVRLKTNKSV